MIGRVWRGRAGRDSVVMRRESEDRDRDENGEESANGTGVVFEWSSLWSG